MPPPPGVVANLDNPQDVLRTVNFVVQGMCLAIASAFVFLRMYTRWFIQKSMFKEDCELYNSAHISANLSS